MEGKLKNKIIYKDKNIIRIILLIFLVIGTGLSLILLFFSNSGFSKLIFLILTSLSIFSFIQTYLRKPILIKKGGICMNNIKISSKQIKLKQYNIFIDWKHIKKIRIVKKVLSSGYTSLLKNIVSIKTDNKKYQDILQDPNTFIKTLKKLNKDYLLDKSSEDK